MGREAGTEGEDVAINYLKNEYESMGIDGGMPDGAYFMPMTLNSYRENRTLEASNVLAFIEGSEIPNEILVITAHLDHIGVEEDGQINNGARYGYWWVCSLTRYPFLHKKRHRP